MAGPGPKRTSQFTAPQSISSAQAGVNSKKTIHEYLTEYEKYLKPEIQRRKKWLQSIPIFCDAGLKESDLEQFANSSVRMDLYNGLSSDLNEHLDHMGGDPNFFLFDDASRKFVWIWT